MSEIPFVAIGNDELGELIGETVKCPLCDGEHEVQYGENIAKDGTRTPSKLLGFYRCNGISYLCAVDGRSVMHKFKRR